MSTLLSLVALNFLAPASNVILMIADGCGFNTYDLAAMADGRLGHEVFNGRGWVHHPMSTYPLRTAQAPAMIGIQDANVVYDTAKAWDGLAAYEWLRSTPTDSAASATAYATGNKTYNHALSWSDMNVAMTNVYDLYKRAGKGVGVVTSVEWSDATPAAMIAHNRNRDNHVEVAREMIASRADVIMGACHPWYDGSGHRRPTMGDASWVGDGDIFVKPISKSNGVRLIESKSDFEALAAKRLDMQGCTRVIGTAQVADGLQVSRDATQDWNHDGKIDGEDRKASPLYGDPFNRTVPDLATMAKGALNVLSNNRNGFFLMVEGGAVDHASHFNWPARAIEEAISFFRATEAVSAWVERHGGWDKNLLIVTTDHECGFVLGPNSDTVAFDKIVDNGKGKLPGFRFNSTGHTNMLAPLFARGAGSEQFANYAVGHDTIRGNYINNTDVFRVIRQSAE